MLRLMPRPVGFVRSHHLVPVAAAIVLATVVTPLWHAPPSARADDVVAAAVVVPPAGDEALRERAAGRAIERGLSWLTTEWEKGGIDKPEKAEQVMGRGSVAAASLAGLAFLQDGAVPGKGRYGAALQQCLDFVTSHADAETGLISSGSAVGPMYGHGYATFFLAEAFARTGDAKLKEKVVAAERLIERSQNTQGGWRYMPRPLDGDVSVTACQLVALRAVQRAGIDVDPKVIERGLRFVATCQGPDGGFSYIPGAVGVSGLARTAAALAVMGHHAVHGGSYDKAASYLVRAAADRRTEPAQGFISYTNYYSAQALPALPADARAKLYAPLRDRIVDRQTDRGAWDGDVSPEYATASAVFALQVPDSRLNLFKPEKKGDKPAKAAPAKDEADKADEN